MRLLAIAVKYALLALGLAAVSVWLADRPGAVTVHWQGWRVDTTVPILVLVMAMTVVLVLWAERLLRFVWRFPARWLEDRRQSRRRRGYLALTQGLAAVAGGDAKAARKLAGQAGALLEDRALTDLLSAQAAQLAGDGPEAERHYQTLADDPKTALTGYRGLMGIAETKGDRAAALDWGRRAWALGGKGALGDLAEQLFGLEAQAGLWTEAEQILDEAQSRRALPKDRVNALKAVSITERAVHARLAGDDSQALSLARSAHKLAPGFVPAAVLAAELLVRKHDPRGASGVLGDTWKLSPHPDVARAWAGLWADQEPLAAFRNLAKALPASPMPVAGHLELARLALDAKLWGQARAHLEAAAQARPNREVYRLLARLERLEREDEAKAAHWIELAAQTDPDAPWTCARCGHPAQSYGPLCPQCGAAASLNGDGA